MDNISFQGMPSFAERKKYATPVRIGLAAIVIIHFFSIYELPAWVLHVTGVWIVLHLISIAYEKAKLSTVEIAGKTCPKCDIAMYSKMIKCEKCGIQLDTDDLKD